MFPHFQIVVTVVLTWFFIIYMVTKGISTLGTVRKILAPIGEAVVIECLPWAVCRFNLWLHYVNTNTIFFLHL